MESVIELIARYNEKHNKHNKRHIERLKGERVSLAVLSWTTASGDIMPLSFKYQDHNNTTYHVKTFTIHHQEDCKYFSEDCRVYECSGILDNLLRSFTLIFFQHRGIWEMYVVG